MAQIIKTMLVDDEYLALNLLETFVGKVSSLEVVAKTKSPIDAVDILQREEIDLLFLDIQMPTLSGNNLLKTLKHPPLTIFTTAYTDYALEAFELDAVDYLLKPFAFERFLQAINKAKQLLPIQAAPINVTLIEKDFFSIKVDGKIVKLYYDDVLYVEGLKEYVSFVCKEARFVTLESLKNLEAILPQDQFIRVHKSFIVAKQYVQSLEGNQLSIGQQKIPISRSKREAIVQAIFYK